MQGDEVTDIMRAHPKLPLMEDGAPSESLLPRMASTNAYLAADVVARGLPPAPSCSSPGALGSVMSRAVSQRRETARIVVVMRSA